MSYFLCAISFLSNTQTVVFNVVMSVMCDCQLSVSAVSEDSVEVTMVADRF